MFPVDSKILIVDDSSFARTMLKNSLVELKYWKLLEAQEARTAQKILLDEEQVKNPVHLVIVDIHMPEMSGLQLLKWLRERQTFKNLPVVILTSSQDKTEILEAGKLGVSHYMIKPFDMATLKEKLNSTWQKHGQKYFEVLGAKI